MPTRRRRHAITETPPVQAALDELREALGDDRVEMGELVVLGARESSRAYGRSETPRPHFVVDSPIGSVVATSRPTERPPMRYVAGAGRGSDGDATADNSAWVRLGDAALPAERADGIADALESGRVGACLPFLLEAGYSARNAREHEELLVELRSLPEYHIDEADEGQLGTLGDPRTQVGVMARAAADVALLLSLVAGPDGRDGGVAPVPLGDPAEVDLSILTVAVQAENEHAVPTAETVAALHDAAGALRAAGATMEPARHPEGGHDVTIEVWRSYGGGQDAAGVWRLLRRWDAFRSEMLALAERYDLILCPVFPGPARAHGTMNPPGEIDPTHFTTPHSLTGRPAATVHAATSPEGLPIGVQLIARPWRDDVALAAALRVEQELGPAPPPQLATGIVR